MSDLQNWAAPAGASGPEFANVVAAKAGLVVRGTITTLLQCLIPYSLLEINNDVTVDLSQLILEQELGSAGAGLPLELFHAVVGDEAAGEGVALLRHRALAAGLVVVELAQRRLHEEDRAVGRVLLGPAAQRRVVVHRLHQLSVLETLAEHP